MLATAAIMHWGVPWLNDQVPYREQVQVGQTMTLEGGVVVTPPTGWAIREGVVSGTGDPTKSVVLTSGATTVELTSGKWSRSVRALHAQIRSTETATGRESALRFIGTPRTFTTANGDPGILSGYTSNKTAGTIGAVLVDGTGIEVQVVTPTTTDDPLAGDVGSVLESIRDGNAR